MTDSNKYKLNHTMLRVKDPKASLKFYETLGMSLLTKFELPGYKLDLYFIGYDSPKAVSHGRDHTDREGVIELTHNYGTENDPSYKSHNGNEEPQGFGHICISVDSVPATCKRLADAGYRFQDRLEDDHIAFALDPDTYWVAITAQDPNNETENVAKTDPETYRMNHTMIRIKDKDVSVKFYEDVFGMNLMRTVENADAGFNAYVLGYGSPAAIDSTDVISDTARCEGLLELTWYYGTEKMDGNVYHNGNTAPQGFGHIAISVDNLEAACQKFEEKGVKWQKRLMDGEFRIAFVLDPDGYWVEIIQNAQYKTAVQ